VDNQPSVELLRLARAGDEDALNRLFDRYLPPLRRWAHGRLPQWARDIGDTEDLVQLAVANTLRQIVRLQLDRQGGFHAYLREAVKNLIKNELRRAARHPQPVELDPAMPGGSSSPLEQAITTEGVERYERALARLSRSDREVIIGRFELGFTFPELAIALSKPSADAARVAVDRALPKLIRFLVEAHAPNTPA
jgi:RNA polymerase sigma-70 factor (ECF subfamily)